MFWCRPVKIIRLVSQHSVEEIILNRAMAKMKLTSAVIAKGQVSNNGKPYDSFILILRATGPHAPDFLKSFRLQTLVYVCVCLYGKYSVTKL